MKIRRPLPHRRTQRHSLHPKNRGHHLARFLGHYWRKIFATGMARRRIAA